MRLARRSIRRSRSRSRMRMRRIVELIDERCDCCCRG
jgi:hypothetical protein